METHVGGFLPQVQSGGGASGGWCHGAGGDGSGDGNHGPFEPGVAALDARAQQVSVLAVVVGATGGAHHGGVFANHVSAVAIEEIVISTASPFVAMLIRPMVERGLRTSATRISVTSTSHPLANRGLEFSNNLEGFDTIALGDVVRARRRVRIAMVEAGAAGIDRVVVKSLTSGGGAVHIDILGLVRYTRLCWVDIVFDHRATCGPIPNGPGDDAHIGLGDNHHQG